MEKLNQSKKRAKPDTSDSDSDVPISTSFPQFIVLESLEEKPLSKLSPFVIEKVISGIVSARSVKKLRDGKLLVEVGKKTYSDSLLRLKTFFEIKIKAFPHRSLNSSRGVVRSKELSLCTLEELKSNLKTQGVTDVRRVSFKRNDEMIPTNTYIMTFDKPVVPSKLKIGYQVVNVDVYVPNPLRCYNCQMFGHHEDRCTKQSVCKRCGQRGSDHDQQACNEDPKCANCSEAHPAYSKTCSAWKREKEILRIKYTQNISFPEARKIVQANSAPSSTSYADMTKKSIEPCQSCHRLIETLKQLTPESLPKFIESLSESNLTASTSTVTKDNSKSTEESNSVKASSKEALSQSEKRHKGPVKLDVSQNSKSGPRKKITLETSNNKQTNRFAPLEDMDTGDPNTEVKAPPAPNSKEAKQKAVKINRPN